MAVFPLLLDPRSYRPCDWDFLEDPAGREHYLTLFHDMAEVTERAAVESGYAPEAAASARRELRARVAELRERPDMLGRLDILALDVLNGRILREHGIEDAFRAIKRRENEVALAQLPARLGAIDAHESPGASARTLGLVRGVFAGNIFDMGAKATAARFEGGRRPTFDEFLREVRARPWTVDDADELRPGGRRKALVFVDNAGADVVLGMLPLVRELLLAGEEVVVAANSRAAWNDVTIDELRNLLSMVRDPAVVEALSLNRLRSVGTGTSAPLLDLADISEELCAEAEGADLVVFEGMGRALESNWDARLACEVWRLATLKDPAIARRKGGDLYNCVCRVDAPGA